MQSYKIKIKRTTSNLPIVRIFFLSALFLLLASVGFAQNKTVQITDGSLTLQQAFKKIEQQTGYRIGYNNSELSSSQTVTIPMNRMSLPDMLNIILNGTGFTYTIIEDIVVINRAKTPKTETTAPVAPAPAPQPAPAPVVQQPVQPVQPVRQPEPQPVAEVQQPVQPAQPVKQPTQTVVAPQPTQTVQQLVVPATEIIQPSATKSDLATPTSVHPILALKTNLLYDFVARTPNLALEVGIGPKSTINLSVGYNPWNWRGSDDNNKKMVHTLIIPEYRYWLCERFNGHFFGVHGIFSSFNIGETKIPLLFDKDQRYEGKAFGGGVSYGYHWIWNKYWAMEFNAGIGAAYMKYEKYDCEKCAEPLGSYTKTYFGPTKIGVSLIYMIR